MLFHRKNDLFHLGVMSSTEYYTSVVIGHLGIPAAVDSAVVYAAIILVGVYVLIGFEVGIVNSGFRRHIRF